MITASLFPSFLSFHEEENNVLKLVFINKVILETSAPLSEPFTNSTSSHSLSTNCACNSLVISDVLI
jgi:hypothetical protein